MNKIIKNDERLCMNESEESDETDPNSKLFNEYNKKYSETVNESISFTGFDVDYFTRVKSDYIKDLCENFSSSESSLKALDVGCGVGNFHRLIGGTFQELHGVDVSSKSIEIAKSHNPDVEYMSYNGKVLPYENNTFDLTITICVLHHVPQDQWDNFISELRRVLKKGGKALIFEHNPRNPLTLRAVNRCPFDADAVLLDQKKTESLLISSGFRNISKQYILSVPAGSRLMRVVDKYLSFLGIGAQYYIHGTK